MNAHSNKFQLDPKNLGDQLERKQLLEEYTLEQLFQQLKSSPIQGLSSDPSDVEIRKEYFGENYIPPKLPHGFFYYLFKAFQDYMLIFLLVGGLVVFITEMIKDIWSFGIDGLAIIIAVIIIVIVTSINDYTKELKFRDLHRSIKMGNTCTVIRGSQIAKINTKDLVVGDIYLPTYGDQIPADAVVFQSSGLRIDESAITGESDLVLKDKNNPYLLAQTYVMDGSGKALIVAVGFNSQTGRIMRLLGASKGKKSKKISDSKQELSNKRSRSILQEKLTRLAMMIGKIGFSAGVLVFAIQCIRYSVSNFAGSNKRKFQTSDIFEYLDLLLQGFTVVVVAVPEGLPLAVTVSLAYSVMRMLKDKNLVRELYSCETMGNTTTICSDKTGTLTTNRMTVIQVYLNGRRYTNINDSGNLCDGHRQAIILNICVNKSPSSTLKQSSVDGAPPAQLGNKTDCALLGFLSLFSTSLDDFNSGFSSEQIVQVFPFNSDKKIMSAIVNVEKGTYRILVKGAPDVLLSKCSMQYIDGKIASMTETQMDQLKNCVNDMATDALRTIVLAFKDIPASIYTPEVTESTLVNDLVFLALFGIEDPVRPDVPEAIRLCKQAGITVRMVTGDNINTAKSIALKCGILGTESDDIILDSAKFNKLIHKNGVFDQKSFDKVWPRLKVLARSSPKDKYILVTGIINTTRSQQIVAVTGDGTNDAPALQAADVGFAMGLTGTDIAKEACDIIITDDNFSNIVKAIQWGRNIYDCISKFLIFQLTVNCVAVTSCIIFSIFWYNIFHSSQLLWINLVMDTLASLALATDLPTEDLLNRKPYSRNKSLLSRFMVVFVILHSLYQLMIIVLLTQFSSEWFSIENNFSLNEYRVKNGLKRADTQHSTFVYNVFVLMQIFNEINARKVHGERNVFQNVLKNKIFLAIFVLTLFLQVIIIEFGSKWFHVVPLSPELWLWSIFISSTVLLYHQVVVIMLAKLLPIPKKYRIQHGIDSSLVLCEDDKVFDPQLMWIRGLRKLQTQLRVINAFKDNLSLTPVIQINIDDNKEYPENYESVNEESQSK